MSALLGTRGEMAVVTGLGSATYDVAAVGDHPRNFYLWGAMGGAASLALGLAMAQPETPVVAITGDGEMLMAIGTFCTIALQAPPNLSIVVLDNGLYGETGSQKSHTGVSDLAGIAKASGIAMIETVTTSSELDEIAASISLTAGGPRVYVVKVSQEPKPRVLPLREGAHAKARFREAFGLTAD